MDAGAYSKALSGGRNNCTMREEKSTAQTDAQTSMYLNRYPHPPCAVREDCFTFTYRCVLLKVWYLPGGFCGTTAGLDLALPTGLCPVIGGVSGATDGLSRLPLMLCVPLSADGGRWSGAVGGPGSDHQAGLGRLP